MNKSCQCVNCIMPPYLLRKLLECADGNLRQAALTTLLSSTRLRIQRSLRISDGIGEAVAPTRGERSIFDCGGQARLAKAKLVRSEGDDAVNDESVNRAFNGIGITHDFFMHVLKRNSVDDRGMRLDGYVHYDYQCLNAFWDGQQMVFGDGDGELAGDLTGSLDVIAHELGHGVTEHVVGLEYHNQPGALDESMSDVFGSLVKQWAQDQTADEADWLIGKEVFTPKFDADALRSMKAPGTAYNNSTFGKDPQPDHISRFVMLPDTEDGDWGGVHINSGIPNKAFYVTAATIGGRAWDAPGRIWYESLKASNPATGFEEFARRTYMMAGEFYGSSQQRAVQEGWGEVGIDATGAPHAFRR